MVMNIKEVPWNMTQSLMQEPDTGISIKNLTKRYKDIIVVNNFDLQIGQDEIVCLIGNNGAGKTTLINMLVGLTRMNHGDAKIYGHLLSKKDDITLIRTNLRLCPQQDLLWEDLTPKEHLELVCKMRAVEPADRVRREVEEKLAMVRLDGDKEVKYLSGGQKRKLSLAMALIGEAKFIIMDDPTSSLDQQSKEQVWDLIKQVSKGRSILIST